MKKKYLIAASALTIALFASPAFAESGKGEDGDRFNLGRVISSLVKERNEDRKEHREENREDRKDDRKHATSTKATSTISVHGTVTAVNSTVITLSGKDGVVHTVQAANATFEDGSLATIAVGDTLKVKGTMSGTVLVATKIEEKGEKHREFKAKLENLRAGIVTSVGSGVFTLTRFGTGSTSTITTNASTTVKVNGQATTTAAITPGSAVIVVGSSSTSTPDTAIASIVHVITKSFGWVKHFLDR